MKKQSGMFYRRFGKHANITTSFAPGNSNRRKCEEAGVALVLALLMLFLMSVLGLGMVLSVSSDMLINGYYGNYRSAYYAADSGLNIARQQLQTQVAALVNTSPPFCATWGPGAATGCTSYPIANPTTGASSVLSSLGTSYGSFNSVNVSGTQAAASWPGQFELNTTTTTLTVTQQPAAACSSCTYQFQYNVVVIGKGAGPQQVTTSEKGYVTIGVTAAGGSGTLTQFSAFGAFINNFQPDTNPLVYGTLTGPFFTNGAWNFGSGGSYVFTGKVAQADANASYDFPSGGGYHYVDTSSTSATYGGVTIAPTFQQGLVTGAPTIAMPANDFSQQWAILDSMGCGEGSNVCGSTSSPTPPAVTNANRNASLKNVGGTAYPTTGTTSGVYIPYTTNSTTHVSTLSGGGFYVEGNADSVTLTPGTDSTSSHNPTQTYTIVQSGTTTTITTNIAANTTTVVSGGTTLNLVGVPQSLVTGSAQAQTLLYVDGDIGTNNNIGLSGPSGETSPAIQNGVQVTIVANGDINVVGNLLYEQEPVTLTTADTLIPANNHNQVLGLFTQSGNVNLNSPYSDNNLEIDGALAMIGSTTCTTNSNTCGLETVGGSINTFNIVGARAEANAHSVSMSQSNTYYDQRFGQPGFGPPWFPATSVSPLVIPTAPTVNTSFSRLNWYTSPQN